MDYSTGIAENGTASDGAFLLSQLSRQSFAITTKAQIIKVTRGGSAMPVSPDTYTFVSYTRDHLAAQEANTHVRVS